MQDSGSVDLPNVTEAAKPKVRRTATDVLKALQVRYPSNTHAFFAEVPNGTGYRKEVRSADALAFSLWPSRGLHLEGFEIKVSRSDWLHELRKPEKANAIAKFCKYWYLVTGNGDEVRDGELPDTWGHLTLIEAKGGFQLRTVKAPEAMKAEPIGVSFLASLMRKISDGMTPTALINDRINEARRNGEEIARGQMNYQQDRAEKELKALELRVREFETKSGLNILAYDGARLGETVAALRAIQNNPETPITDLLMKLNSISSMVDNLKYQVGTKIAACETLEKELQKPDAKERKF